MRYVVAGLFVIALLASGSAMAREGRKVADVLKNPIEMNDGNFAAYGRHLQSFSLKGINCKLCHHMETSDGDLFVPCTNEECHATPGARERDTMSLFMAYHDKNADRSCYGCHKKEAASHPQFKGCRPCHMSPQARAALVEK